MRVRRTDQVGQHKPHPRHVRGPSRMVWFISVALGTCLVGLPALADELRGIVTYVRDGDTIEVDGQAVRLQGVAAPETHEPKGREAKAFMTKLTHGKRVICDLTGEVSYDRVIGTCRLADAMTIGGNDIGGMMIQAGLARDCPKFSSGRYRDLETDASRSLPFPGYCEP